MRNSTTRIPGPGRRSSAAVVLTTCVALFGCAVEPDGPAAESWSQWRGPAGLGVTSQSNLPTRWSAESSNIVWKTALPGRGNSSPVVGNDRVFLTAVEGLEETEGTAKAKRAQLRRLAFAVDLETGELLWRRDLYSAPAEQTHQLNTPAAATPAVDGDDVFVYFGSVLARLTADGTVVWQHEIDPTYFRYSRYGAASSPVLTDKHVIVFQDREFAHNEDIGWLAAYDRETGGEVWRTEWTDTCCAYSTPLLIDAEEGLRMLVAMSGELAEFDPATGKQLWGTSYSMLQMVGSPVLENGILAVAGGANQNRGFAVYRLGARGVEPELLWHQIPLAPQNASSVLYDGRLYSVTDQGIMTAFAAETGELLWRARLDQSSNRASLLAGDGKIYVVSREGPTSVVAAEDAFRLISQNTLGRRNLNASPAVVDGTLLLRTRGHLVRVARETEPSDAADEAAP